MAAIRPASGSLVIWRATASSMILRVRASLISRSTANMP
jgi:hypothetical protein